MLALAVSNLNLLNAACAYKRLFSKDFILTIEYIKKVLILFTTSKAQS